MGETKTPAFAFKKHVTAVSEHFHAAFCGKFSESQSSTLALPDVSEPTFLLFSEWMLTNLVLGPAVNKHRVELDYEQLVDAYIFADEYQVKRFSEDLIRVFEDKMHGSNSSLPSTAEISKICEFIPENDPLPILLAEKWASAMDDGKKLGNLKELGRELAGSFLMDVAMIAP